MIAVKNDPEPLAVLPEEAMWHKVKERARTWAETYPTAEGYIKIKKANTLDGYFFYRINHGKATACSAIECLPEFFKQQEQRLREYNALRKASMHPVCPCCQCERPYWRWNHD